MATAPIVYTDNNPNGRSGTLFEGKKFWLSRTVPQRSRFKELIENNGGVVVDLEQHADIKLVDHTKKEIPLNTYSYQYVEKSVRNGRLEDLEDHRAGKTRASTRPVGAYGIPSRQHRRPYTLEDDQILWDWVQPYEVAGMHVSGNIIYQQLAEKHPQHTFQSWRDHYLKHVRGRPRPGGSRAEQEQNDNPDNERNPTDNAHNHQMIQRARPQRSPLHRAETLNRSPQNSRTSARVESSTVLPDISPSRSSMRPARTPKRTPERKSGRRDGSPAVKSRGSPSNQPHAPSIADRRATTSRIPLMPTNSNDPVEFSQGSIVMSTQVMTAAENMKKRKRLSEDGPAVPSFDTDRLTKDKRRAAATDNRQNVVPSTADQFRQVKMKSEDQASQASTTDETDTDNFETAPQLQSTIWKKTSAQTQFETAPQFQQSTVSTETPSQTQAASNTSRTELEEINLNAFMALPFPPLLPSDLEDDDIINGTTKNGDSSSGEKIIRGIDEWIEQRLRTGKAKNEQQIITALRCTTMDPDLADRVLDYLAAGKGIPQHMRGVWTAEDDASMEGTDARNIDRLLKKHGSELYNARFEYLEMVRAASLT